MWHVTRRHGMRVAFQHRRTTSWNLCMMCVTILMRSRHSSYIVWSSRTTVEMLTLFQPEKHRDQLPRSPMLCLNRLGTGWVLKVLWHLICRLLREKSRMKALLRRSPSAQRMINLSAVHQRKLLAWEVEKISSLKRMLYSVSTLWCDSVSENEHRLKIVVKVTTSEIWRVWYADS